MRFTHLYLKKQNSMRGRRKLYYLNPPSDIQTIVLKSYFLWHTVYFKRFKKFLKKIFKKKILVKKKKFVPFYVWVNLKANFPLRRKSRNARMGKGIGKLFSWLIKYKYNTKVFYFNGVSPKVLLNLTKNLRRSLNIRLCVFKF
jgi:hypothetical protein